jgi:hypothetical protein
MPVAMRVDKSSFREKFGLLVSPLRVKSTDGVVIVLEKTDHGVAADP